MSVKIRLGLMMFLQYAIWGAWYVTVGNYMNTIGMTSVIHWAYTVSPISSIISPFFLGMIADRFFATERVLGILHIIGGISILLTPLAAAVSPTFFILLLLIHMLAYMPTVGLTNTLAFANLSNQEKDFPLIRVFGTIGWIIAGIFVSKILGADESSLPLTIAGIASLLMGFFSFTLPHTPPPAKGEKTSFRKIIGIDAIKKLNTKSFVIFIISSFLISIPLAVYYAYAPVFLNETGIENPAFVMSFGQMSEVVFILIMPMLFPILGVKKMLLTGMGAWALRYFLFALGADESIAWMIISGVILHGICYDFFFVAGFIYVDKTAPVDIRGQAQGFIILATYGFGMLIGSQIAGLLFNNIISGTNLLEWQNFWFIPAIFATVVMIFFGTMFKENKV
ncbi:MAG: MFS transporter [Ignavibacteriales bacterium]|nr:MFS transporter [Ignavibacteriales bacterium]